MTIALVTEDRTALPVLLLPLAKTHMRVDTADDDDFIKSAIGRAIAHFQETNEVTVNPSTFAWTPALKAFTADAAPTPVRPVTQAVVLDNAVEPPATVTANYTVRLKWDGVYGVPIQVLAGPASGELGVTLTAGYPDLNSLPLAVLDTVLRHTGHLYEHRDILVPDQPYVAPDLATNAAWWMPRV